MESEQQESVNLMGTRIVMDRALAGSWAARAAINSEKTWALLACIFAWAETGDEKSLKFVDRFVDAGANDPRKLPMPNLDFMDEAGGTHVIIHD